MKISVQLYMSLLLLIVLFQPSYSQKQHFGPEDHSGNTSSDFQVDKELIYNSSPFSSYDQAVAFNGDVYVIAWVDTRNLKDFKLYYARLDKFGNLIDSAGICLYNNGYSQSSPQIATNGDIFLLVWESILYGNDQRGSDIFGARLDHNGVLMDSEMIPISREYEYEKNARVASDGENFCVVWQSDPLGSPIGINGTFVSKSGDVSHPDGIQIFLGPHSASTPDLCFDGSRYFIVWCDGGYTLGVYGLFLSTDGTPSPVNGELILFMDCSTYTPAVCWNGELFYIAFAGFISVHQTKIVGARFNHLGECLDQEAVLLSTAPIQDAYSPDVCWDGNNFLASFGATYLYDNYKIMACRISTDGQVLDPDLITITDEKNNAQIKPGLCMGTDKLMVTWSDARDNLNKQIFGAFMDASGQLDPPGGIEVSNGYNGQFYGTGAFGGSDYYLVWLDTRSERYNADIYGMRMNQQGHAMDPHPTKIFFETSISNLSLTFNGENFLAVWQDSKQIGGVMISPEGAITGDSLIKIAPNYVSNPFVASDGINCLVVYEDDYHRIYFKMIAPDGTVLFPSGVRIIDNEFGQGSPFVIFDGTNYVIALCDNRMTQVGYYDIFMTRVSPDGTILDTGGFPVYVNANEAKYKPVVTYGANKYLVCWAEGQTPNNYLRGLVLDQDFQPIAEEPLLICDNMNVLYYPSITYNDGKFVVLYSEVDTTTGITFVGASYISTEGVIIQQENIAINESDVMLPSIVKGTGEQALALYSKFLIDLDGNPVNTFRLYGKKIGQWPGPGIAELPSASSLENLHLWPVPAGSDFNIGFTLNNKSNISLIIYDNSGRLIFNKNYHDLLKGNQNLSVRCKEWTPGIYFVNIKAENEDYIARVLIGKN